MSVTTPGDIFASGVSLSALGLYFWLADFGRREGRHATWSEIMRDLFEPTEARDALTELALAGFVSRSTRDGEAAYAVDVTV